LVFVFELKPLALDAKSSNDVWSLYLFTYPLVIRGPVPYLLGNYLPYLDHLKPKTTVSFEQVIILAGYTLNEVCTVDI